MADAVQRTRGKGLLSAVPQQGSGGQPATAGGFSPKYSKGYPGRQEWAARTLTPYEQL